MTDARGAWPPAAQGLYDPRHEHDACGLGFIANIKGRKSHAIIAQGLKILENLSHRGATGADPLQGDGAGILIQIPDAFLRRACGKLGITLPAIGQYGVGMVFLPREPASRMRLSARSPPRARCCSDGATCRPRTRASPSARRKSSR
jgi:glutamate synthase domain-containing protein 1